MHTNVPHPPLPPSPPPQLPQPCTDPYPPMDPSSIPLKKHRQCLFTAARCGRVVAVGQHGLPSVNRLALIREQAVWMQKPVSALVWPIYLRLCSELIHQAGSQALMLCSDHKINCVFILNRHRHAVKAQARVLLETVDGCKSNTCRNQTR